MNGGSVNMRDGTGRGPTGGGRVPSSRSRRARRTERGRLVALALVCVAVTTVATLVTTGSRPAPAAGPETATMLTVYDGHGWGHGIGLSQWGTYGYATKTSLTYRQILSHYYSGIGFSSVGNRTVRVLLNDGRTSVYVSSSAGFTITNGVRTKRIPGDARARITWDQARGASRVYWGTGSAYLTGRLVVRPGTKPVQLVNKNQNGSSGVHYRGSLCVYHLAAGYTIVDHVALESYLYGVVPHESPAWWPSRALVVQAVAARSYAVASLRKGGLFDVYCTTRSQVYDGIDGRGGEQKSTTAAVEATRGVVATYAGKVITAVFFSTSGGRTENVENVWTGASPVPYLKSVADPYESQDSTGRTGSPYHVWSQPVRFTEAQLSAALGLSGPFTTVAVTGRGVSPRVVTAFVVQGDVGQGYVGQTIAGDSLRAKLGLRSTWFDLRTVSITPAGATPPTIAPGGSVTLSGAVYPVLAAGESATLQYRAEGQDWRTWPTTPTTTPGTTTVGGVTLDYTAWSVDVSPTTTTMFRLTVGSAVSPETTVTVTP
jgi:stage II sporulation protein D